MMISSHLSLMVSLESNDEVSSSIVSPYVCYPCSQKLKPIDENILNRHYVYVYNYSLKNIKCIAIENIL